MYQPHKITCLKSHGKHFIRNDLSVWMRGEVIGMINLLTEEKFMDHHLYATEGESHGGGQVQSLASRSSQLSWTCYRSKTEGNDWRSFTSLQERKSCDAGLARTLHTRQKGEEQLLLTKKQRSDGYSQCNLVPCWFWACAKV